MKLSEEDGHRDCPQHHAEEDGGDGNVTVSTFHVRRFAVAEGVQCDAERSGHHAQRLEEADQAGRRDGAHGDEAHVIAVEVRGRHVRNGDGGRVHSHFAHVAADKPDQRHQHKVHQNAASAKDQGNAQAHHVAQAEDEADRVEIEDHAPTIGLLKSLRVVAGSFGIALYAFRHGEAPHMERTDRDIPILAIPLGVVLGAIGVAAFFGLLHVSWTVVAVGLALTLLFSFFFTTVAANAIATTANNPASGMTLLTVIVSALVLLRFGLSGTTGMFFVMALAGMVCVALCASGQFITDLKSGYWIGSTPSAQEKVKFIGVIAAAITAGLTIILLAKAFQFGEAVPGDPRQVLVAPQASALKAVVSGFMSGQPVAYMLFGIGAMVTVVLEMLGLSSMVFALGIYLPLQLTTPILVGGFLSHLVNKRGEKVGGQHGNTIRERGIIIAGGLMAGGALGGVIGAALRVLPHFNEEWIQTPFYANNTVSQSVSALLFIGLCLYVWFGSLKKVSTEEE